MSRHWTDTVELVEAGKGSIYTFKGLHMDTAKELCLRHGVTYSPELSASIGGYGGIFKAHDVRLDCATHLLNKQKADDALQFLLFQLFCHIIYTAHPKVRFSFDMHFGMDKSGVVLTHSAYVERFDFTRNTIDYKITATVKAAHLVQQNSLGHHTKIIQTNGRTTDNLNPPAVYHDCVIFDDQVKIIHSPLTTKATERDIFGTVMDAKVARSVGIDKIIFNGDGKSNLVMYGKGGTMKFQTYRPQTGDLFASVKMFNEDFQTKREAEIAKCFAKLEENNQ